jgi:hypothetical protein
MISSHRQLQRNYCCGKFLYHYLHRILTRFITPTQCVQEKKRRKSYRPSGHHNPSFPPLVSGKLVLLGDSLGRLVEPVLSVSGTATANGRLVLVESALAGHLGSVGVDGGLAGGTTNSLSTALTVGLLAAVVVELVGGHALHGLAETGVDVGGARAAERVGGGGLVVGGLCGGLLGVAGEGCVGGGAAGGEDLCAELGGGVVAYEDTGLVLKMVLVDVWHWFGEMGSLTPSWFSREAPAGLGLNSPEPPVGIWLATASMLLLVELAADMLMFGGFGDLGML